MLKHKKHFSIFLILCIAVITLTACSARSNAVFPNSIAHTQLNSAQQELLNRISLVNQEILLFDFRVDSSFSGIEVWLEVYEYGVATERFDALSIAFGEPSAFEGELSILVNRTNADYTVWGISLGIGGALAQKTELTQVKQDAFLHGLMRISAPIQIRDGEEIVLLKNYYATEPGLAYPYAGLDLLEHSTYTYIIKARFF